MSDYDSVISSFFKPLFYVSAQGLNKALPRDLQPCEGRSETAERERPTLPLVFLSGLAGVLTQRKGVVLIMDEVEDGGASVSASVFRPSSLDGLKTDEEEMSQQLRKCVESYDLHFLALFTISGRNICIHGALWER